MKTDNTDILNIPQSLYIYQSKDFERQIPILMKSGQPDNIKLAFQLINGNFPEHIEAEKKVYSHSVFVDFVRTDFIEIENRQDSAFIDVPIIINKYQKWGRNIFWFRIGLVVAVKRGRKFLTIGVFNSETKTVKCFPFKRLKIDLGDYTEEQLSAKFNSSLKKGFEVAINHMFEMILN